MSSSDADRMERAVSRAVPKSAAGMKSLTGRPQMSAESSSSVVQSSLADNSRYESVWATAAIGIARRVAVMASS